MANVVARKTQDVEVVVVVVDVLRIMSVKINNIRIIRYVICTFITCFFVLSCSTGKKLPSAKDDLKHQQKRSLNSFTLGERKILDIIKLQDDLFADPNINNMGAFAHSELQTKALRIEAMWRTYFLENPNDYSALILYGKFLRRIGQSEKAYNAFLKADNIEPNIPVVKQQLSALEAEDGQVAKAFKHIKQALAMDPNNQTYLTQTAYILVAGKNKLANGLVLSNKEYDTLLTDCYKVIYQQNPSDKEAKIRYAQSFYDLFEPDWQKALSLWNEILEVSALNHERQMVKANIARVLVELNRDAEAEEILKSVNAENLQRAKRLLLKEIERVKNTNLKK